MKRIASILLLLVILVAACTQEASLTHTPAPTLTDSTQEFTATPSASTTESRLSFATEAKPKLDEDVESVKATLTAGGMESGFIGKTRDDSYYALIGECGGAVEVREAILDETIPPEHLQPLNFQFWAGWDDPIEWHVLSFNSNGVWNVLVTGSTTDDCEVIVQ